MKQYPLITMLHLKFFHLYVTVAKPITDDSNEWIHISFPKVSIHLKTLRAELSLSNLFKFVLYWPTSSWKNVFFCLALTVQKLGPSSWDIGTDMHQGEAYLTGDTYIKTANSRNDSSIMNYDCTWVGTTRSVNNDTESEIGVTYTFECLEKDVIWGWLTLGLVFIFPGLCQAIFLYAKSDFTKGKSCKLKSYISMLLILLIPFFPLQVFIIKLLTLLSNGPEMKKIRNLMIYLEGAFESSFQFILQLYIIFTRADRQPSTTQLLSISTSILFMAKAHLEANFADKPDEPLSRKLVMLPQKLCFIIHFCGSAAILASTFQMSFFIMVLVSYALVFLLCCFCMKTKISQGSSWYNQKIKELSILSVSKDVLSILTLFALLVLINYFPDTAIPTLSYEGLPKSWIFSRRKLSNIAIVDENWANYIIPPVMVSCGVYWILFYNQVVQLERMTIVSLDKGFEKMYKITKGDLKESTLENEVIKISVEGKSYLVPKKDLDLEKHPLETDTEIVTKNSIEKEKNCFEMAKNKIVDSISCGTSGNENNAPPNKNIFIVRKQNLKEIQK